MEPFCFACRRTIGVTRPPHHPPAPLDNSARANEGGGAPGSVSPDVPHGARGCEELGRHGEGAGMGNVGQGAVVGGAGGREGMCSCIAWPWSYEHIPSRPYNAGMELVGFRPARVTIIAPSAKRRAVSSGLLGGLNVKPTEKAVLLKNINKAYPVLQNLPLVELTPAANVMLLSKM